MSFVMPIASQARNMPKQVKQNMAKFLYFRVALLALLLSFVSGDCIDLDLGMESKAIPDNKITASTEQSASNTPANNGRLNFASGSSWCAAASDSNPYLQIDLQTLHIICAVSTQGNSQADQWVTNYTLQTSTDGTTWSDYTEDGQVKHFEGNIDRNSEVKHVLYGVVTRYLRFLPNAHQGSVCMRVEVFGVKQKPVNLALGKTATQSTTSSSQNAGNAVDGNSGLCSKTQHGNPSWWRVDLGTNLVPVIDIYIVNSFDSGSSVTNTDYKITFGGDSTVSNNPVCKGRYSFTNFKASAVCFMNPLKTGRYVGIMTTKSQVLQLCEVEVYSRDNLAFGKPTYQYSGTYKEGKSSKAVDGNSNTHFQYGKPEGSCSMTDRTTKPWWRVDLQQVEHVTEVYLVRRGSECGCPDRFKNFEIRVGTESSGTSLANPKCGDTYTDRLPVGQGTSFFCHPSLKGRYVIIRLLNVEPLTLCEVEVYSERRACPMQAIGVASSDAFPNNSFSALSASIGNEASKGRLNGVGAWSPRTDTDPNDYLQIDLKYEYIICAVATQGKPTADEWTKEYKVRLSLDGTSWVTYQENNVSKVFSGNSGRNDIVKHSLKEVVSARFIRFQPTKYNTHKALRVEVYGVLLSTVPSQAPSGFNVVANTSTSITASWQLPPEYARHGTITGFKLFYKKKGSAGSAKEFTFNSGVTGKVVSGLQKYTEYEFQMLAINSNGDGRKSMVKVERTMEDAPSTPASLTYILVAPSELHGPRINLTWSRPTNENGFIRNYTVFYSHNGDTKEKFLGRDALNYIVDVLGGVTYQFHVQAVTIKPGPNVSTTVNIPEYEPSSGPENVSANKVNYTTFQLTWNALPKDVANGIIKIYQVRLILKENCTFTQTASAINTTATSLVLTGISMCAKYEVSVRGYTAVGPGPYSNPIVLQTLVVTWSREMPSAPSFPSNSSERGITAKITLPRFPTNAKFFQVILITFRSDYSGDVDSPQSFAPQDLLTYEEAHESSVPAAYVTFQFGGKDFDKYQEFVVGNEARSNSQTRSKRNCDGPMEFKNEPLTPNTNYRVFLRAFVTETVYVSSNFLEMDIKERSEVKKLPEKIILAVGELAVLTCEASGNPEPSVTWTKDGDTNIPRAQFKNDGRILVIQNVLPSDTGTYECKASNKFGESRTSTTVIIAVPPTITEDISPSSVICERQTLCFIPCHASSNTPFNYTWTKNDQVPVGDNIKVMNNSIVVTPRDAKDYGVYVCHATNSFGSTSYKITLRESQTSSIASDTTKGDSNLHNIFRVGVITLSCVVLVLLAVICMLIWRLRRAVPKNGTTMADKVITDDVPRDVPCDQHMIGDTNSYLELRPRPSEEQTPTPQEYEALQDENETPGYYNAVLDKESCENEDDVYTEIVNVNC